MSNLDELREVLEELCEYCLSDELTLPTLQDKLDQCPLHEVKAHYSFYPFFHNVCVSKGVTLEIVEYVLDKFPDAVRTISEDMSGYVGCMDTERALPLHLACFNQYCAHSVIKLIMEKYPPAISYFCLAGENVLQTGDYCDDIEGAPLHYYVMRETNIQIETMIMLITAYPQAILATDSEHHYTPLHAILGKEDKYINNRLHALKLLLAEQPLLIRTVMSNGKSPLLVACSNKYVTFEVVRFIYNLWPEAVRVPTIDGFPPIQFLCCNKLPQSADILRLMLATDPGLVRERDGSGDLPIHTAASGQSFDFCKVLIDLYPESLKVEGSDGYLPVHFAVSKPDILQYMLCLYPETINARDNAGRLLIHKAAQRGRVDLVELLLMHDPSAATKATRHPRNSVNNLPLHLAARAAHTEVAEVLFDAYPESMNISNGMEKTPLDLAWEEESRHRRDPNESKVISFLLTQQAYARQAQDIKAKTTIDKDDWLHLHCALKDKAPLGSIKLLVRALRSVGHTDSLPLNTACEFSSVKVVRYLIKADSPSEERLSSLHLVHSACRGGNLKVIKYFLDEHTSLVASAEVNEKGELPIYLLCEAGKDKVDKDSTEYVETIWRMLLANPEAVVGA